MCYTVKYFIGDQMVERLHFKQYPMMRECQEQAAAFGADRFEVIQDAKPGTFKRAVLADKSKGTWTSKKIIASGYDKRGQR